jgi:putative peptidoglycan lipid II flippase
MRLPFLVALVGVVVDVGLAVALFPHWSQVGIAVAAAASGWVNAVVLAGFAWRRGYLGLDGDARRRLPRLALSGLVMAVALLVLVPALAPWTEAGTAGVIRITALAVLCLGGLGVFLAACLAFGGIDRGGLRAALRPGPRPSDTLRSS